jgi:hypothetical protein
MSTTVPVAAKANGLTTALNTIAAPGEAFETLSVAPAWGWALVLTLVFMLAGVYLQGPAARHAGMAAVQHMVTTSSLFANATQAQKNQAIAKAGKPNAFTYVFPVVTVFLAALFNTIVLLVGNAVGGGKADFKRLWCGSVNIAFPTLGIGAVVLGAILTLRGPDSFNGTGDLFAAMPSLAWIAPHASGALLAFLSAISIFALWGLFLNATMLRVMAKTSAGIAYGFATLVMLLGALIAGGFGALGAAFGTG